MSVSFLNQPKGLMGKIRSWLRSDPLRQRHQAETIVNDVLWSFEYFGVRVQPEVRERVTVFLMLHIRHHPWQTRNRYIDVAMDEFQRIHYGRPKTK